MIVITDSNIFYSALISPLGTIAKILKEKRKIQFIAPNFMIEEIENYIPDIALYTHKSKREIYRNFEQILENVKVLEVSKISKKIIEKSMEIVKEVDSDDLFFVALHFETGHKIWTGDKELMNGLAQKGYHIFVTTEELRRKIYK